MDADLIFSIGAIAALLLLSGFFSGSETALTAASRARMHTLEQQGDSRARLVNRLWHRKERLIGAILLGNNAVNILASAIATSVLIRLVGEAAIAYATIGMTLLVLVFAEVLPKTYALMFAEKVALFVAPVMRVVVTVFNPVVRLVNGIVAATLRLFGTRVALAYGSEEWEEELRGAIELHKGPGDEVRHEREMLRSILDLADVEVSEIMVHRRNVTTINADQPFERIIEEVLSSPHTRLPLWQDQPDNIVGVLHAKALFRAVQAAGGKLDDLDIGSIAAKPWFIPDSSDLLSQLHAFRKRQEHFAIVVDEYGELLGVVTLEDILEEIVGDISDEHDIEVEGVEVLKDGAAIVNGWVTIRDLNRKCDWRLPDEEAATVAGLVLHEARRIPEVGMTFAFHGFRFEILGRQRNQITLIKLTSLEPVADDDGVRESLAAS
ncbi:HlyC/CorC family transporter [Algihabitans albus]|uniref:HlyC/CorC family transporter n=1 Tax=Algihabitans albus TaxID=2164067 RepID=UPI000E5CF776|nr:HlyC/CorC family transporter [Algihabitans albus]